MSVKEYRRKIEAEIAAAAAAATVPAWSAGVEAVGGDNLLGAADADATPRLRSLVGRRAAGTEARAAAFAEVLSRGAGAESAVREALAALADATESAEVRHVALGHLKVAAFASPTHSEWRPDYIEALRGACRAADQGLRNAAFEVLAAMGDKEAQDLLIKGLEDPVSALVPPEHALGLLSNDPHTRARDVARKIVAGETRGVVRTQALRLLAADPHSIDTFRALVNDGTELVDARRIAASALANLAPEQLEAAAAEPLVGLEASAKPDSASVHLRGLLKSAKPQG